MALQNTSGDSVIFHDSFISNKSVADNGGVVTGTPVINKGFKTVSVSTDYVNFASALGRMKKNFTRLSMRWKGSIDFSLSDNYANIFSLNDGGVGFANLTFVLMRNSSLSKLELAVSDGTNYYVVQTGTLTSNQIYDVVAVWNGGNSITIYVDSVDATSSVVASSGTVTTIDSADLVNMILGRANAAGTYKSSTFTKSIELFDKALTAEEVKDLYENDTIQELDHPLIDLPLRSSYYKANGVQLVVGSNMELANWTANNNATLSNPVAGTLRVAYNGTASPYAFQTILTIGKRYKLTGTFNGDGVTYPVVYDSGIVSLVQGTLSTTPQSFSKEFVAVGTQLQLYSAGVTGACDFQNIRVELMENLTENKGTLGGTAKMGDGSTLTTMPTLLTPHGASFGAGKYIDTKILDRWTISSKFSFGGYFTIPNTADGNVQGLVSNRALALGGIDLRFDGTGNLIFIVYDGASVYVGRYGQAPKVINGTIFVTYDGSNTVAGFKIYVNTKRIDTASLGAGTVSSIVSNRNLLLGMINATYPMSAGAKTKGFSIYENELTPRQVSIMHNKLLKEINI